MKKKYILFILFTLINNLFAAAPEWFLNLESVYPDQEYLAAIGQGIDETTSRQNAITELASYFSSSVSSKITASTVAGQKSVNGEQTAFSEKQINQNMVIEYDGVKLFGLQFTKSYKDSKTKSWYTCAYIDRKKAANQWISLLEDYLTTFESYYEDAKKKEKDDPYTALQLYIKSKEPAEQLSASINYLRVINLEKSKSYSTVAQNISTLSHVIELCKKNCILYVECSGDYDSIFSNMIKKEFQNKGFTIVNTKESANYIVSLKIDDHLKTESYGDDKIYTMKPSASFSFINNKTKTIIKTETIVGNKAGNGIEKTALQKKLYPALSNNLSELIKKNF